MSHARMGFRAALASCCPTPTCVPRAYGVPAADELQAGSGIVCPTRVWGSGRQPPPSTALRSVSHARMGFRPPGRAEQMGMVCVPRAYGVPAEEAIEALGKRVCPTRVWGSGNRRYNQALRYGVSHARMGFRLIEQHTPQVEKCVPRAYGVPEATGLASERASVCPTRVWGSGFQRRLTA